MLGSGSVSHRSLEAHACKASVHAEITEILRWQSKSLLVLVRASRLPLVLGPDVGGHPATMISNKHTMVQHLLPGCRYGTADNHIRTTPMNSIVGMETVNKHVTKMTSNTYLSLGVLTRYLTISLLQFIKPIGDRFVGGSPATAHDSEKKKLRQSTII
jgi:hypothetical protein